MTNVFSILILISMIIISSCSSNKATNPDEEDILEIESVKIDNQVWMLKNLDVSHYRNGDEIFNAKTRLEWKQANEQGIGAWCYYENAPGLGEIFGKLYNWYAVNDQRGLAPEGWRVPSDDDWKELINYYSQNFAGAFLKSKGVEIWQEPNKGANNYSGFSALPGGRRQNMTGHFLTIHYYGYWWSNTESSPLEAITVHLTYNSTSIVNEPYSKENGFSVRCIKD